MRLLLDVNILMDVAFDRPGSGASSAVIALCDQHHEAWLAWHSLSILAYVIERQRSSELARAFLAETLSWAKVAPTVHQDALEALNWPMSDLEDALQAAAARACGASYILTRNVTDFSGSPVEAIAPEEFLALSTEG